MTDTEKTVEDVNDVKEQPVEESEVEATDGKPVDDMDELTSKEDDEEPAE